MPTPKFIYPPDQANYSVTDGVETVSIRLDGGASRTRRDVLNSTSLVNVSWTLSRVQYEYFRAFYRDDAFGATGANPFLIDLIIDEALSLTEHTARFVPGSVSLSQQSGLTYRVTAQLEVEPVVYPEGYFPIIIALIEEFGDDASNPDILPFLSLAKLVTEDMPGTEVFGG